jgi:hypothetical protein
LESGELDRSRSALDEARALFPDAPEIPALEARLIAPPQPVIVEAPIVQPPPVEPPIVQSRPIEAPVTDRPIVAELPDEPKEDEPEEVEVPDEPELPLHPQVAGTLFSATNYQAPPENRRRVLPMIGAVAAVALFAVAGFAVTQFYLAHPERQTEFAASEPLPAPDRTPAEPAKTEHPQPAASTLSPPPAREEPAREEPASAEPSRAEPPVVEPARAEPTRGELSRAEPARGELTRGELTRGELSRADPARGEPTREREIVPASRSETAAPAPKPTPPPPATSPAAPPTPERTERLTPVDPLPAVADRTATSPTTGSSTAPPAAVASTPPPATTPAVETPTETPRPPARPASQTEEPLIRAVLARYEAAYNRLDATAASSVYPGVNREALGRAFGGLLSQKVSLGLCDITVIGDIGGASCVGKARWEPKVGGGARTADRRWSFSLRRSADGWRIEQVVVR